MFSTPSAQLFDTNPIYDDVHERALWSPVNSSFSSEYCAFGGAAAAGRPRRNPELAARHAAAAARHAAAAARHANAAAKFAGLRMRTSAEGGRRRSHAGNGPLCESAFLLSLYISVQSEILVAQAFMIPRSPLHEAPEFYKVGCRIFV